MQKTFHHLVFLALLFVAGISCKKDHTEISETSAFTLVNGVGDATNLITDFNGDQPNSVYYAKMNKVDYGYSKFFNSYSGTQKLALYRIPDTTVKDAPIFNLTLNLPVNNMQTLFLMGTSGDPDQLLITNQLLTHAPADSVMGIRFINISKGSGPLTVNLVGKSPGSEVDNLDYKQVTPFKIYPAHAKVSSYTFEFRDKVSGKLLGTCLVDGVNISGQSINANRRRNKNFTLAFLSLSGGGAPDRVMIVDEDMIL